MDAEVVTTILSNLGVVGVLVWFLYFTTTVTLPSLQKEHTLAYKELSDRFLGAVDEEREFRRQESELRKLELSNILQVLKEERELRQEELKQFLIALQENKQ